MPRCRSGGSRVALASMVVAAMLSGCSAGNDATDSEALPRAGERSAPRAAEKPGAESLAHARCRPDLPHCRTTAGRIIFVERVDPDGDGDAHFVVLDPQGITLPGFTAIDVRKGLRPDPLPGIGDLISAAGPVQTGSYGQSQIHAVQLHVAGR